MNKHLKEIKDVLHKEYGIGLLYASGSVGVWAAEKCSNPNKALSELNKVLEKNGRPICYPPYGGKVF